MYSYYETDQSESNAESLELVGHIFKTTNQREEGGHANYFIAPRSVSLASV